MKNQAFFSSEDKSKKIKMSSATFLFCALRVNTDYPDISKLENSCLLVSGP